MPIWNEARLINRIRISPTTYHLVFEQLEGDFNFLAGQFITLDLPIGEKRLDRWRSYSIAGRTLQPNQFELCIGLVPDGKGSTYLCHSLKDGEVIRYKSPSGSFTLKTEGVDRIILVATGTGIAPFRAMLRDHLSEIVQPVHLVFGCRTEDEILYREEICGMVGQYPHFSYDICLSRAQVEGCHHGYVHSRYTSIIEEYGPSERIHVYLCGWQRMVDEANQRLTGELALTSAQVHIELYG